ncbi:MAG TPA: hypothetical protein VM056_06135, partial [Terriglobales bacterium]|nr:hypothetical protein [Terriglobales bacterium]
GYRIPSSRLDVAAFRRDLNTQLLTKTGGAKTANYIRGVKWPIISVADDAFPGMKAEEAEKLVGEAALAVRPEFRGYYTKSQLKAGDVRKDDLERKYLNSYSPHGGSYVMILPAPFLIGTSDTKYRNDTDHSMPFSYDTHVPLLFYGFPFQAGIYRGKAEPVDLAVTLASLLGINQPSHAVGRVLTEALAPARPAASGDNERPRERTQ